MLLKFLVWAKLVLFVLLVVYLLTFIGCNSQRMELWLYPGSTGTIETNLLLGLAITFFLGAALALMARTLFRTFRQINELRTRNRSARLEHEIEEMKARTAQSSTAKQP